MTHTTPGGDKIGIVPLRSEHLMSQHEHSDPYQGCSIVNKHSSSIHLTVTDSNKIYNNP